MPAGDFENHELMFLSTDIQLRVHKKLLNVTSDQMAAVLQLTHTSFGQVRVFNTPHNGVVKQYVWPLWQHAITASGSQTRSL